MSSIMFGAPRYAKRQTIGGFLARIAGRALLTLGLIALTLFAAVYGVSAAEVATCELFSGPKARIEAGGGTVVELDKEQLNFARGIWVNTEGTHSDLPAGDKAYWAHGGFERDGKPSQLDSVYFVDGDQVCARMWVSAKFAPTILFIGAGDVVHVGAPA